MNMIPEIKPIRSYEFPSMENEQLSNGIPLSIIPFGPSELVRVDCVICVGILQQPDFFVASFTHKLMREGTRKHTSKEIANFFDFYGASFISNVTQEHTIFSLLTLEKYLPQMLEMFREILFEPVFSENEFSLMLKSEKQQFLINEEKVTTIANRGLKRCIYGTNGTLGKSPSIQDYNSLDLDSLKKFHHRYFVINNCHFYLSGNTSHDVKKIMNDVFGSIEWRKNYCYPSVEYIEFPESERTMYLFKEDSVQSAIYVGRKLFGIHHPDFHKVSVLSTLFGGYFGSRLMSNIREEKGYTYGINSVLRRTERDVISVVATQTANQYVKPLLTELYKEMDRLSFEEISLSELDIVKSYIMGDILRSFDGSFSLVDSYISMSIEGEDLSTFYKEKTEAVRCITPKDLKMMAQQYFDKRDYFEVVAGKMD